MRSFGFAILMLAAGLAAARENKAANSLPGTKAKGEPVVGYERRMIEGFNVLINKRILSQSFENFEKKPFEVLEDELKGVGRVISPKYLKVLKQVPIWVEWDEGEQKPDGGRTIALYYGGDFRAYLRGGQVDPRKANNIEVVTLKFLTQLKQPGRKHDQVVLLHELIHAVHDKEIGFNQPDIRAAYDQARSRELYASVEHKNGPKREAYANTNHREYFAEITCMYLDRVDYFPYDKEGLKTYDPVAFALAEKIWGKVAAKPRPETKAVAKAEPKSKPTTHALTAKIEIDGEKVAADKLANIRDLIKLGKKDRAKDRLQELIKAHPDTKAAVEAEKILKEIS